MDVGVGDGLFAFEQALAQRLAVGGMEQGAADADVGQDRIVEPHIDVLVKQSRFVDDLVLVAVAFLETEGLVERDAGLAGDIVDSAGQKIGF